MTLALVKDPSVLCRQSGCPKSRLGTLTMCRQLRPRQWVTRALVETWGGVARAIHQLYTGIAGKGPLFTPRDSSPHPRHPHQLDPPSHSSVPSSQTVIFLGVMVYLMAR